MMRLAVIITLLALQTAGQSTPAPTTFSCEVADTCTSETLINNYATYSASDAVKSNVPEESFPEEGDNTWDEYTISAATNPIILMIWACLACCCLCVYVWSINRDETKWCCCLPGPSECWADNRKFAWGLMAIIVLAWFILIILAFHYNSTFSDSIRDVPQVLNTFADYLTGPISNDVNCVITEAEAVDTAASQLVNDPAVVANSTLSNVIDEISYHVGNFSDTLNGTDNSILSGINDAAREIKNSASDAQDWTNQAGDAVEEFIYTCFVIVLLVGLANIAMGIYTAKRGNGSNFFLSMCSSIMTCVMWVIYIVCVITLFVVRFEAGWCEKPFEIIETYVAANNASRSNAATYYLTCSTMTDAELKENWPYRDEQNETQTEYDNMVRDLGVLDEGGADVRNLTYSINVLGCSLASDTGLLGYQGIFSCGVFDRFLQAIAVQLCDTMYEPLNSLYLCAVLLAFLMIVTVYVNTILRRNKTEETNEGEQYEMQEKGGQPPPYA